MPTLYRKPPWLDEDDPEPVDPWPPEMEEYGAYKACKGCFFLDERTDDCYLCDPRKDCIAQEEILKEMGLA